MSQSIQEPSFGADIYFYYVKDKGKLKKIRVRISEFQPSKYGGYYVTQRVRDGYISHKKNLEGLTKEEN